MRWVIAAWICLTFTVPNFVYAPMGGIFEPPAPPFELQLILWLFFSASAAILYPSWSRSCHRAGTVDLVQRVSTGIEVRGDALRPTPELPQEMERLDMRIRYRGHSLDLRLTRNSLTIRGRDGAAAPITLCVDGEVCDFVSGTTRVFRLSDTATNGADATERPRKHEHEQGLNA